MEIVTQQLADALEVKVKGRLDNYWGEHLQRNLEELIRGGAHHLRLNFSGVSYLSSAGVGLLVRFYRQLKAIGGSFVIVTPSDHVKLVIELCHLSPLLLSQQPAAPPPVSQAAPRRFATSAASFELIERSATRPLTYEAIGNPALLKSCGFGPQDCRAVRFPASTFGLGLGAFGHGFEDARTRFGEFLAVEGSAAYLPTDGTNIPDFMVSRGDLVPELNTLYGLRCEGDFSHLLRFEASTDAISFAEIVGTALEVSGSPNIGLVMIAESGGLVGATLRRSPAAQGAVVSVSRYSYVVVFFNGTSLRALPRPGYWGSFFHSLRALRFPSTPARRTSRFLSLRPFSRRGLLLSPIAEGRDRSEIHRQRTFRIGKPTGRSPSAHRRPPSRRSAAEQIRAWRLLDQRTFWSPMSVHRP